MHLKIKIHYMLKAETLAYTLPVESNNGGGNGGGLIQISLIG